MHDLILRIIVYASELLFIVWAIFLVIRQRKLSKQLVKTYQDSSDGMMRRYKLYTVLVQNEYKKFAEDATARINVLSKENVRLREENEQMRDKLKNLGFTNNH